MSCVNCQCDQPCCFEYCDTRYLLPLDLNYSIIPVAIVPNAILGQGAPLTRAADGRYTLFDPTATPPQRFAGILSRNWQTDSNGNGILRSCYPNCNMVEVAMYVSGLFRLSDMDITVDQLNAIVAQGRGYVHGDPNTRSGTLQLF
jgi:hypothetical protein